MSLITDLRVALRSLGRVKGVAITVILTLALGIGANAAIFSLVRGVLLTPLVNDDEERLVYIRQSAMGRGSENANFSVPEIRDLRSRVKSIAAFGDFSTIEFTMVGLGEPRVVRAGVVGGNYFNVMGLRPVAGRLLDATDDGPTAAPAAVLTHRFWTTGLNSDPSVIGKTIKLGDRAVTIVGVLEPSIPYPAQTELIANVVTSSHHMDATMVDGRVHRMTELFGRLAPGADIEAARAELRVAHGAMLTEHREDYPVKDDFQINAVQLRDQISTAARSRTARVWCARWLPPCARCGPSSGHSSFASPPPIGSRVAGTSSSRSNWPANSSRLAWISSTAPPAATPRRQRSRSALATRRRLPGAFVVTPAS